MSFTAPMASVAKWILITLWGFVPRRRVSTWCRRSWLVAGGGFGDPTPLPSWPWYPLPLGSLPRYCPRHFRLNFLHHSGGQPYAGLWMIGQWDQLVAVEIVTARCVTVRVAVTSSMSTAPPKPQILGQRLVATPVSDVGPAVVATTAVEGRELFAPADELTSRRSRRQGVHHSPTYHGIGHSHGNSRYRCAKVNS